MQVSVHPQVNGGHHQVVGSDHGEVGKLARGSVFAANNF